MSEKTTSLGPPTTALPTGFERRQGRRSKQGIESEVSSLSFQTSTLSSTMVLRVGAIGNFMRCSICFIHVCI
jgi:hypothetical protein